LKRKYCREVISSLPIILFLPLLAYNGVIGSSFKDAKIRSTKLIRIETRPGIKQKFILIKPDNPFASVILFPGGHGSIQLTSFLGIPSVGPGWEGNFVVRTRKDFAKHGFMVALVDAPSDKQPDNPGLTWVGLNTITKDNEIFRVSIEHAQDIKAVASYLKNEAKVPIWLVGTSFGTFSAANGAIRAREEIKGLILTSSMTRSDAKSPIYKRYPNFIINLELDRITVPTLIVSHREDRCYATPPEGAQRIREALINSPKVEVKYFAGGKPPLEQDCWGLSPHGFYGIEDQVLTAIADFIKSNSQ
jgi:pimeloyl-ACP methyl ester carboxylesterase